MADCKIETIEELRQQLKPGAPCYFAALSIQADIDAGRLIVLADGRIVAKSSTQPAPAPPSEPIGPPAPPPSALQPGSFQLYRAFADLDFALKRTRPMQTSRARIYAGQLMGAVK